MAKKSYPSKPKAPKASAPLKSHENFHTKMKDWDAKCKQIDKDNASLEKALKATANLKAGKTASGKAKKSR